MEDIKEGLIKAISLIKNNVGDYNKILLICHNNKKDFVEKTIKNIDGNYYIEIITTDRNDEDKVFIISTVDDSFVKVCFTDEN